MAKVLTPQEKKDLLRRRLEKVLKSLPARWINLFVHVNAEYKGKEGHLDNVRAGKSLDEEVIVRMEELATALKKIKSK